MRTQCLFVVIVVFVTSLSYAEVPLRTRPRRFSQDLGSKKGVPTVTEVRTLSQLPPLEFGIKGVEAGDTAALKAKYPEIIAEMQAIQQAVAKATKPLPSGKRPATEAIIQSLEEETKHATGEYQSVLKQMVIAALVQTKMNTGESVYIWSYRRLFGNGENWGPE